MAWAAISRLRGPRVLNSATQLRPGCTCEGLILRLESVKGFLFQLFEIEQSVVGALGCPDEFVELDLDRFRVAILRVLNQEHHQKRDDRSAGVDDQLPCV